MAISRESRERAPLGAVLIFSRPAGAPAAVLFGAHACRVPAPPETQGEAIAWEGGGYLTIGEGAAAPL